MEMFLLPSYPEMNLYQFDAFEIRSGQSRMTTYCAIKFVRFNPTYRCRRLVLDPENRKQHCSLSITHLSRSSLQPPYANFQINYYPVLVTPDVTRDISLHPYTA
jgi:hypothetical protein